MALVKCPDCGKMVSNRAIRCMGCGCPMEHILGQAEKTIQAVGTEKEYIYCSVSFALDYQSSRTYWFISDEEVKVGDHAIVRAGYENEEKEVVIKEVKIIKGGQIPPYPVRQTKKLLRLIKEKVVKQELSGAYCPLCGEVWLKKDTKKCPNCCVDLKWTGNGFQEIYEDDFLGDFEEADYSGEYFEEDEMDYGDPYDDYDDGGGADFGYLEDFDEEY